MIYTCISFAVLFFLFTAIPTKSYSHYTSCIFLFHLFALCTNATFSAKSRICHQILFKQFCQRRSVELTVIFYLIPLLPQKPAIFDNSCTHISNGLKFWPAFLDSYWTIRLIINPIHQIQILLMCVRLFFSFFCLFSHGTNNDLLFGVFAFATFSILCISGY